MLCCGPMKMHSFLAACECRAADVALHQAVQTHLRSPPGTPAWRIEWREGRGRVLVAARDLPAATLVFCEHPLVVAAVVDAGGDAHNGEAQAVGSALLDMTAEAAAVLCSPAHVAGTAEATAFAKAAEAFAKACPKHDPQRARHCLGIASVNVHGAERPRRGVLGVLSSMMEHECSPSARVTLGDEAGGSLLSLRTLRRVVKGESLSITYVPAYQPTAVRRGQLLQQHGFTCRCVRCEEAPELVRCFVCPSCREGPASPASSRADCRTLICTECGASSQLDHESWEVLMAAEASEDLGECVRHLHPYHHKMVVAYRHNIARVPIAGGQRAELFCQFADARIRLTSDELDPLAAADLERAAVSFRAAGDVHSAARVFSSANEGYAAHYGVESPEAARCRRAIAALG